MHIVNLLCYTYIYSPYKYDPIEINQVGFCWLYVIMLRRTFLFILSLLVIEEKAEIVIFVNGNFSLGKQTSPLKRHTEGAIKNEQSRETKC